MWSLMSKTVIAELGLSFRAKDCGVKKHCLLFTRTVHTFKPTHVCFWVFFWSHWYCLPSPKPGVDFLNDFAHRQPNHPLYQNNSGETSHKGSLGPTLHSTFRVLDCKSEKTSTPIPRDSEFAALLSLLLSVQLMNVPRLIVGSRHSLSGALVL